MEKERGSKVLAVIALVVGLVGLSLGFASFSKELTIDAPTGDVTQVNTLNVHFVEGSVNADVLAGTTPAVSGDVATVSGTSITGLRATFQQKGDKIQYVFQVKNDATYPAYLNAITFSKDVPTCVAKSGDGVNPPSVDVAALCGQLVDMDVEVVNNEDPADSQLVSGTKASIDGHVLGAGKVETVKVTLEYVGDMDSDGDFTVDFGTVTLTYGSVDN